MKTEKEKKKGESDMSVQLVVVACKTFITSLSREGTKCSMLILPTRDLVKPPVIVAFPSHSEHNPEIAFASMHETTDDTVQTNIFWFILKGDKNSVFVFFFGM